MRNYMTYDVTTMSDKAFLDYFGKNPLGVIQSVEKKNDKVEVLYEGAEVVSVSLAAFKNRVQTAHFEDVINQKLQFLIKLEQKNDSILTIISDFFSQFCGKGSVPKESSVLPSATPGNKQQEAGSSCEKEPVRRTEVKDVPVPDEILKHKGYFGAMHYGNACEKLISKDLGSWIIYNDRSLGLTILVVEKDPAGLTRYNKKPVAEKGLDYTLKTHGLKPTKMVENKYRLSEFH